MTRATLAPMPTFLPITEHDDGPRRYPWDEWLEPGREVILKMGEDFDREPRSFLAYIYKMAGRRKLKVRAFCHWDDTVHFVTYREGDRRPVLAGAPRPNGRGPAPTVHAAPQIPEDWPRCVRCGRPLTAFAVSQGDVCAKVTDSGYVCEEPQVTGS